jgi:hypothetical protein
MNASVAPVAPLVDPWMEHMRRGNFAAAWEVSDAALRQRGGQSCAHWPRHQQYVWDGRPLAGKRVLIRCYHGLGDTVQFIRYVPLVKSMAREVIVWAQPALLPLLASLRGIDRALPLHDGAPEIAYDVDVEVMELPYVFRSTPASLPARVPYLGSGRTMPPSRDRLRVGLVWSAGDWDLRRSIPFDVLRALFECEGVEFHALQRGAAAEAIRAVPSVRDSGTDDVALTATAMSALDLMISVDSFPVHLAGALGVPTWLLLPEPADWRWMTDRPDSPWYPTMRLFRQPRPGAWASVVARVARELEQVVRARAENRGEAGRPMPTSSRIAG